MVSKFIVQITEFDDSVLWINEATLDTEHDDVDETWIVSSDPLSKKIKVSIVNEV